MLIGLHPLLTPDLLYALARMGHGDEIVIADGNFPAASCAGGHPLIHLPGVPVPDVVAAVLTVLPLDTFVAAPIARMEVVGDPAAIPVVVAEVQWRLAALFPAPAIESVERQAFYERAKAAFAIVATSDNRPYGNIILKKGVVNGAPEKSKSHTAGETP